MILGAIMSILDATIAHTLAWALGLTFLTLLPTAVLALTERGGES